MEIKISKDSTWLMNWMDNMGYMTTKPTQMTAQELLDRMRAQQKPKGTDDD